jgi:hypothetical protein
MADQALAWVLVMVMQCAAVCVKQGGAPEVHVVVAVLVVVHCSDLF